jgi:hypothetical protein
MAVNMRFTIRPKDNGDIIDFIQRDVAEMSPARHAVLLDKYDTKSDLVTYKDPNYGDVEVKVTSEQLLAMAGTGSIQLRSFSQLPGARSKLNVLAD